MEKISGERNDRNKSSFIWLNNDKATRNKLEIGSSIRPDPYEKRYLKTYIQKYLEEKNGDDLIANYELTEVGINTLSIERTFIDKLFAVKRHGICGTLNNKVRHIYDVVMLYSCPEVQSFLADSEGLKRLMGITKETDFFYLGKRDICGKYNAKGPYDFGAWEECFNEEVRKKYEKLHEDLLYTDERQNFGLAIATFKEINNKLRQIDE